MAGIKKKNWKRPNQSELQKKNFRKVRRLIENKHEEDCVLVSANPPVKRLHTSDTTTNNNNNNNNNNRKSQ